MKRYVLAALTGAAILHFPVEADANPVDLQAALRTIRAVGPEGAGNAEASVAWNQIAAADSSQLVQVLAAMQDSEPLACNWLRAAVDTIVQRELASGRELPQASLIKFLKNTAMSPRGRRTAYELLQRIFPDAEQSFIPEMLNDPSLELRRDAVALVLDEAKKLRDAKKRTDAIAKYGQAFRAARDVDQIEKAFEELAALDTEVDLARHYGFITRWHIVAPFDNTDTKGFDVTYPPELSVDLSATYSGKRNRQVQWRSHLSKDPHGIVDFNEAFKDDDGEKELGGNYKGAIGYAYAVFVSDRDQTVDVRLGCINGNKVWVNGEEITSNHVYHSGMEIDQYAAQVELTMGKNEILVKLAQNEQTEQWAQRWQFQLRICDAIGTAILSTDRPLSDKTAAREQFLRGFTR